MLLELNKDSPYQWHTYAYIHIFTVSDISRFLQRVRVARNAKRCTSYRTMSVCPSYTVTDRYCVQTNEDTIISFSLRLVSREVKFIRILFARDHRQRGR